MIMMTMMMMLILMMVLINSKGNRTIADLGYEGKDIISLSTFIIAPIKS